MKIVDVRRLIDRGDFPQTADWKKIDSDIRGAVAAVEWPPGSGSFTLYDEPGKGRGEGSGVKPIKDAFLKHLLSRGWSLETVLPIPSAKALGAFDAAYRLGSKLFCVEWETGNISSSHRAINKMSLGLITDTLIGGVLILPTRNMYKYLTDRVGNFEELEPYFSLWTSLPVAEGLLAVMAIEHDAVSKSVPRIPKGTNGRARE